MPLPNLLIQYQCTAPTCSRMSSPLNVLHLLPTIEELMASSAAGSNTATIAVPFVAMRLKQCAEKSCPFCRAPSRIIPIDPSFQDPEIRTALKTIFGSFFGHAGPDLMESQHPQWKPVQVPGNEAGIARGTKVQWVLVGGQVHQLLMAASPFTRELQQYQQQGPRVVQATNLPGAGTRSISAPPEPTIQDPSSMSDQSPFRVGFDLPHFQPQAGLPAPDLMGGQQLPFATPAGFPFEEMPDYLEEGQEIMFDRFGSAPPETSSTATAAPDLTWAEIARRGESQWPSDWPPQ